VFLLLLPSQNSQLFTQSTLEGLNLATLLQIERTVSCKTSGYSLADVLNYTALAPSKENDLSIIQSRFIREAPPVIESDETGDEGVPPKPPRKVKVQLPPKMTTVADYRSWLETELRKLTATHPQEEIELEINN